MTATDKPEEIWAIIGYQGHDATSGRLLTSGEFHSVFGIRYGEETSYTLTDTVEEAVAEAYRRGRADMRDEAVQPKMGKLYAVRHQSRWHIAQPVFAKIYGPNSAGLNENDLVWSASYSTAFLGLVGEEDDIAALPDDKPTPEESNDA